MLKSVYGGLVAALFALPLAAQSPVPASTFALGFTTGVASSSTRDVERRTGAGTLPAFAQLSLGAARAGLPVELRLDAMLVGFSTYAGGPLSATANVVVPVGSLATLGTVLRPYAVAGSGVYGVGGVGRTWTGNVGAGVRATLGHGLAFVELRHHAAYGRTMLGVGAALRL